MALVRNYCTFEILATSFIAIPLYYITTGRFDQPTTSTIAIGKVQPTTSTTTAVNSQETMSPPTNTVNNLKGQSTTEVTTGITSIEKSQPVTKICPVSEVWV